MYSPLGECGNPSSQAIELLAVPVSSRQHVDKDSGSNISIASAEDLPLLPSKTCGPDSSTAPAQDATELSKQWIKHQGWRSSATIVFWTAAAILVINTAVLLYSAFLPRSRGLSVAFSGDCGRVNRSATLLHVAINVLSSILLSASNYIMQCVSAPFRSDIDKAHAKGRWMDIGVASAGNLLLVDRQRALLWLLLAVSSVPLHLFYNAAVFKTVGATTYDVLAVDPGFVDAYMDGQDILPVMAAADRLLPNIQAASAVGVQKLTNPECIDAFSSQFDTAFGRVLLVTQNSTDRLDKQMGIWWHLSDVGFDFGEVIPYKWLCEVQRNTCTPEGRPGNSSEWLFHAWDHGDRASVPPISISYCLAQQIKPSCTLEFSSQVMGIVLCCNLAKLTAIFMAKRTPEHRLLSVGDAIETFLDRQDPWTKNNCLLSVTDVRRLAILNHDPKQPVLRPHRVASALSMPQTLITLCLWILMCALAALFFALGAQSVPIDFAISNFGKIDGRAVLPFELNIGAAGFINASLLANLPQLLLSFFYLMWNNCFTSMQMAFEYSKFASNAKSLSVTSPNRTTQSAQRSTYWLSLPFRYSIPMMAANAALHWLTSLAVFPIQISVSSRGAWGGRNTDVINRVGFSLAPMLPCFVLGGLMTISIILFSLRRVSSQMPVAGNCSWAISAACHRPPDDNDAALLPVQWGDVSDADARYGHCTFTSVPVRPLQSDRRYI